MIVRQKLHRYMAALSAALIIANPALCLAVTGRSVAIGPLMDGDSDEASREISREIADALKAVSTHHVVDSDLAADVASYQGPAAASSPDAAALISAAKDHYFNFRYDAATQSLERAILLLNAERGSSDANAQLMDAYISRALIANSRGKRDAAREALQKAMEINPMLRIAADLYPPSMVSLFDELSASRAGMASGSLLVKSVPEGADVLINGIAQGKAPLALDRLPAGRYSLTLKASRYAPTEKGVVIVAGRQTQVKLKLKWARGKEGLRGQGVDEASAAVREGARLADELKVERYVLIDADAAGKGALDVTARTIDRTLRAGARPLRIEGLTQAARSEMLAELMKGIAGQIDLDMASDPAGSIYPAGEADAAVLAKRKKPLTRQPLFWGAIGAAAVGAIIGGVLASMSGGPSTGSIKVSFK